jgi:1,4-dihydroxy-2-naphthoate octaprenyltransferase
MTLRGLLTASRLLYLPGGLLLYLLGVLMSARVEALKTLPVALGAFVIVLVHVITHFVNDAEDVLTDDQTEHPTAFTGGSRAIQLGLVTPAGLKRAADALASCVGVVLVFEVVVTGDWVAAALYLGILVLGYGYSGRPFMFGRRGLGELVTATVMGVLVPVAGAHAARGLGRPCWLRRCWSCSWRLCLRV